MATGAGEILGAMVITQVGTTHGLTHSTILGITEDFMTRGTTAVTGAVTGADIGDGMTRGIIIITITDGMTLITTDLLI